jgi:DNA-binding transcriptional LysR family regulator
LRNGARFIRESPIFLVSSHPYNGPSTRAKVTVISRRGRAGALGVPAHETAGRGGNDGTTLEEFARFRAYDWIGNSRNTADEDVIRTLASMAGFTPRITHQADSLELVQDMITAGLGVGLLPTGQATSPGVRLIPLDGPQVELRAYAAARHGRLSWPPLAVVIGLLRRASRTTTPADDGRG